MIQLKTIADIEENDIHRKTIEETNVNRALDTIKYKTSFVFVFKCNLGTLMAIVNNLLLIQ